MVIFGIQLTEENKTTKEYFKTFTERLNENNMFHNPFSGNIKSLGSGTYVLDLNIIYPRVYYLGFALLVIGFLISGLKFNAWLLPGAVMLCFWFFWTRFFFVLMLRLGLNKKGYKGKVKLIGSDKIIRGFLKNGAK